MHRAGNLYVVTRQKVINEILKTFCIELLLGESIAFFEISVENYKGYPVSVIKLDTDSILSCVRASTDTWELPDDITYDDDNNLTNKSGLNLLLSDDADDETT